MTTNHLTICGCGADLQKALTDFRATTVVEEGGKRFVLLHCPLCGTLYFAIDERRSAAHPVGAGA